MTIAVADVGATHCRIGTADADAALTNVSVTDTPQTYDDALAIFKEYRAGIPGSVDAVSIGIAGEMEDGVLVSAAHLPGWCGKSLAHDFSEIFSAPAYVENDTFMGGLGEAVKGAGNSCSVVAYLAVGTGVGGRRVVDGVVDPSSDLSIGHQKFTIDGVEKELEEFVSGTAISREGLEAMYAHPDAQFWLTRAGYLAHGVYRLLAAWGPDCVVFGGSLVRPDRMSTDMILEKVQALEPGRNLPPFKYSTLEFPGLIGAAIHASRTLKA